LWQWPITFSPSDAKKNTDASEKLAGLECSYRNLTEKPNPASAAGTPSTHMKPGILP
jgi:hypothetical protein